jgi:hypothetical protein
MMSSSLPTLISIFKDANIITVVIIADHMRASYDAEVRKATPKSMEGRICRREASMILFLIIIPRTIEG